MVVDQLQCLLADIRKLAKSADSVKKTAAGYTNIAITLKKNNAMYALEEQIVGGKFVVPAERSVVLVLVPTLTPISEKATVSSPEFDRCFNAARSRQEDM